MFYHTSCWTDTGCDGEFDDQSPINIETSGTTLDESGIPLKFLNYDLEPNSYTLTNDGRRLVLTVDTNSTDVPQFAQLTDSSTFDIYELHSINFNWKSEHQIDGTNSEMEIQFIHFNMKYGSTFDIALSGDGESSTDFSNVPSDALAILSIMVEETKFNNDNYEELLKYLLKVYSNNATRITKFR